MKFIKELIFGVRRQPVDVMSTGLRTLEPKKKPSYEDWCNEFKVSMLYDRKAIYLEEGEASIN